MNDITVIEELSIIQGILQESFVTIECLKFQVLKEKGKKTGRIKLNILDLENTIYKAYKELSQWKHNVYEK